MSLVVKHFDLARNSEFLRYHNDTETTAIAKIIKSHVPLKRSVRLFL